MCDYFDYLYFSGAQAHEAEKSKAALVHCLPDLNIQTSLPRMLRALNGFRKLSPGSSRFPLPWEVLGAMIGWLTSFGHAEMALALIVMFTCYLRPSELMWLRICDVMHHGKRWIINLAPGDTGRTTKTGLTDEAIDLSSQIFGRLGDALFEFIKARGFTRDSMKKSASPLWTFSIHQLRQIVEKCVAALNIPEGFSLYMLRHGGVTRDVLLDYREWLEAKTRGRWLSDVMLKRYCKPGLIARYINAIDPKVMKYGEQVMADDATIQKLLSEELAIAPPTLAPRSAKQPAKKGPLAAPIADAEPTSSDEEVEDTPPKRPKSKEKSILRESAMKAVKKKTTKAMKVPVVKVMKVIPKPRARVMKVMKVKPKPRARAMKAMKVKTMKAMKVIKRPSAARGRR